jgi:hypothetical protein
MVKSAGQVRGHSLIQSTQWCAESLRTLDQCSVTATWPWQR